jgi:hypothetical protein
VQLAQSSPHTPQNALYCKGDEGSALIVLFLLHRSPTLLIVPNIKDAISNAFSNLAESAPQVYDYWVSELYDVNGEILEDQWNENTLRMMEDDVMNLLNN